VGAEWRANLTRTVKLRMSNDYSRQLDYSLLVPAQSLQSAAGGTLRLTTATRFDFDLNHQWYTPQGEVLQTSTRLFTRFNWQFLEPIGLRLVQQTTLEDDATHRPCSRVC
jgi:hypothetical protein